MNKDSLVHYAYELTRPSAPAHRVPVGGRWKGVVRTIFHLLVIDRIEKEKIKLFGSVSLQFYCMWGPIVCGVLMHIEFPVYLKSK